MRKFNNRDELIAWINSLEEKYDVNSWQLKNTHLWPLIKINLSFLGKSNSKPPKKISEIKNLLDVIQGLFVFLKILFRKKSKKNTNIFCLAPHFRFNDGVHLVNRYFNQLINQTQNVGKDFLLLDYGTSKSVYINKVDYPSQTFFLHKIKYFALGVRELLWRLFMPKTEWNGFNEFIVEVKSNTDHSISKVAIIRQFVYIKILSQIYKIILKKYNVSEIYILCYYVSEMYAMNLAASELDIPTCDIQHGGQGKLHTAYANFNKVPQSGYRLLPKKFWCWDKASAEVIASWINPKQKFHRVDVKGNPWIEYCMQRYAIEVFSQRKIILYTLQPTEEDIIDGYIIDAIKNTPPSYEWWIRLHPRQIQDKDKLKNLLTSANLINKVEIERAYALPLPAILSNCFIHISKFSGSILEAYMLQIKTIIISKIGIDSFPDVAKSQLASFALNENSDELLSKILSEDITNKKIYY